MFCLKLAFTVYCNVTSRASSNAIGVGYRGRCNGEKCLLYNIEPLVIFLTAHVPMTSPHSERCATESLHPLVC
jgi:hypothetical protein